MQGFERIIHADPDPQFPSAWWRGGSGRNYVLTYFPLEAAPPCGIAVYVLAHWTADTERWEPLWIGQGDGVDLGVLQDPRLAGTVRLGALHVHVHMLARNEAERVAVVADLLRAWPALAERAAAAPAPQAEPSAERGAEAAD